MNKVFFHSLGRQFKNIRKSPIKKLVEYLFDKENTALRRIDYIVCSDDYLLEINKLHLKHDYYTDIITFDYSDKSSITGEVYISLDRVKENSKLFRKNFEEEILRVVIHGALHLCGYKDKTPKEITLMRRKEDFYINKFDCFT